GDHAVGARLALAASITAVHVRLGAVLDLVVAGRQLAHAVGAHLADAIRAERAALHGLARAAFLAAAVDVRLGAVLQVVVARGRGPGIGHATVAAGATAAAAASASARAATRVASRLDRIGDFEMRGAATRSEPDGHERTAQENAQPSKSEGSH